jgi:hypothetical protein
VDFHVAGDQGIKIICLLASLYHRFAVSGLLNTLVGDADLNLSSLVAVYVLPVVAVVTTLFRLCIRYTRGKLWWDDAWAFVSAVLSVIFAVAVILHVKDPSKFHRFIAIK